jgi:anthranilate synthase component 1
MRLTLADNIPALLRSGDNFAYFAAFDDLTATNGKEYLFSGGSVVRYDGSPHFLCSEAKKFSTGLPAMITFDYAGEIFPDVPIMRSGWPPAMVLEPESMDEGRIARPDGYVPVVSDAGSVHGEMIGEIEQARDRIINGELLQVVLSREFPASPCRSTDALHTYLYSDRSLYVFYFRFGSYEVYGSSPEKLVQFHDGRVMMNPIAGTRRRGMTADEDIQLEKDLLLDSKELCEHRMLVDLTRNDLARVCDPESVLVTVDRKVRKYRSVQHIVSEVTGMLQSDRCADDVLRAVFPAGTVSGAPKKRALRVISEYEKTARGPYSGSLGVIGKNSMDLALIIRSRYGIDGKMITRAGAGIVKDSVPENESMEMLHKAATVM